MHPQSIKRIWLQCSACNRHFQRYRSPLVRREVFCSKACYLEACRTSGLFHFWARIDCTATCWLWRGQFDPDGYGVVNLYGETRCHRLMWRLAYGPIPKGLWVLHHCDTPGCVRPDHIYLGHGLQNAADRAQRHRTAMGERNGSRLYPERLVRGEANARAKLTADAVCAIRAADFNEPGAVTHLAKLYQVDRTTIYKARRGQAWRHVP